MYISRLKSIKIKYLLILICLLFATISIYRISNVPPSLSWDEASVGYDAYSIVKDGKDQWGEAFPLAFKSFEEYKYPFHIYTTAILIKIFGLSETIVRMPSVIFGVFNILILFFLVRLITQKKELAILSVVFLAISPFFLHFSRVNWETNFALFFFLAGLFLFFTSLQKNPFSLVLSFLCFGLDVYTYNATKIFTPLFVLVLFFIYRKELMISKIRKYLFISIFVFVSLLSLNILNPRLSGITRFKQVSFDENLIRNTILYKLTNNRQFGKIEIISKQYLSHFSPQFLFISGDKNPRHSTQMVGEFYWIDLLLVPLGLFALVKSKAKYRYVLLSWLFLAPIPTSLTIEAPHASRSMFMLGSWQIISAFGINYLFQKIRTKIFKIAIICIFFTILLIALAYYLYVYFYIYPSRFSSDWQYGYQQIFQRYSTKFDNYNHIYISDSLGQPYIFALFYLKYDPSKFRSSVEYNTSIRRKTSLVKSFDKFIFIDNFSNVQKGKNIIFATPFETVINASFKDVVLNLDGSIAFNIYESDNNR